MLYQCGIIEPAFQVTCFRINFSTIQNLSSSCKCPSTTRKGLHDGYIVVIYLNSSPRNDLKGQEAHCRRVASSPLRKGLRPQRNYWCTYSEEACRISSGTNGSGSVVHTIPNHTIPLTFTTFGNLLSLSITTSMQVLPALDPSGQKQGRSKHLLVVLLVQVEVPLHTCGRLCFSLFDLVQPCSTLFNPVRPCTSLFDLVCLQTMSDPVQLSRSNLWVNGS